MGALALLLILGIVQGFTEFLPVSSSAHLVFGLTWLPGAQDLPDHELIVVWLHLGTLLAVVLFYWRRLLQMAAGLVGARPDAAVQRLLIVKLAIATVPAVAVTLLFNDQISALFEKPLPCAVALMVTGTFLFLSTRIPDRGRSMEQLGLAGAFVVGCIQAVAIMPGISRSGSTIVAGLLVGMSLESATHFSFLMSIPAILGAVIFKAGDAMHLMQDQAALQTPLLAGLAASFAIGFLSLGLLLWIARRRRLQWFAPYCWIVGAAALVASLG